MEAIGIPPVLHLGSCVDNSRILTVLTQVATEGGLGEDIDDLPGGRPLPRVDVREGDRHRHLLRRLRRARDLRREQPGEGVERGHRADDEGLGSAGRRRSRVHPRLERDAGALARADRRQARGPQAARLRPDAVRRQRRQPVLRGDPRLPRRARRRSRRSAARPMRWATPAQTAHDHEHEATGHSHDHDGDGEEA